MTEPQRLEWLRTIATRMGIRIDEDHVEDWEGLGEGYWLIDDTTGNGPWPDDNFSTSLDEVEYKLFALAVERGLRWET